MTHSFKFFVVLLISLLLISPSPAAHFEREELITSIKLLPEEKQNNSLIISNLSTDSSEEDTAPRRRWVYIFHFIPSDTNLLQVGKRWISVQRGSSEDERTWRSWMPSVGGLAMWSHFHPCPQVLRLPFPSRIISSSLRCSECMFFKPIIFEFNPINPLGIFQLFENIERKNLWSLSEKSAS